MPNAASMKKKLPFSAFSPFLKECQVNNQKNIEI